MNKIEYCNENKNFMNWIITIAVNKTKDWFKKSKKYFINEIDISDFDCIENHTINTKTDNFDDFIYKNDNEFIKILNEAEKKLNDNERELIRFRLNEITFKDIADMLNKNENAVKTGHHRAITKLKKICFDIYSEKEKNKEVING